MTDGSWLAVPVELPPRGRVAPFELNGEELLLCNVEGEPHVISNRCPHAGVALAPGVLRGCVLECPFHGGKLDVRTGEPAAPPIRTNVRRFPVRAVGEGWEVRL